MKTGRRSLEGFIPYFARNRDETDVAYQRGWDDFNENMARSQPYQKDMLKKAYWDGYDASRQDAVKTDSHLKRPLFKEGKSYR